MQIGSAGADVSPERRHPDDRCAASGVRDIICKHTAERCLEEFGACVRAIVLTGSLARDEATVVAGRGVWRVLGDAEFLVIFQEGSELPGDFAISFLSQSIDFALKQSRVQCSISIGAGHGSYLRELRPSIFGYELQALGQVIWGDLTVLSLIPPISSKAIPPDDAFCLLCNRITEQLADLGAITGASASLPSGFRYRTVKLYLDMATSLLVFAGAYAPTYRERNERLRLLAGEASAGEWPFSLRDFAGDVSTCTRSKLKMTGDDEDSEISIAFWRQAVSYAHSLWRWECLRLLGPTAQGSDRVLAESWMRRQPVSSRLRGWAYVIRKRGVTRGWREALRETRPSWGTSPRGIIYAAACELFFELPHLLSAEAGSEGAQIDWKDRASKLPLSIGPEDSPGWRGFAAAIVRNYEHFLVGTRA